jgi:hypothetical protein
LSVTTMLDADVSLRDVQIPAVTPTHEQRCATPRPQEPRPPRQPHPRRPHGLRNMIDILIGSRLCREHGAHRHVLNWRIRSTLRLRELS